MNGDGQQPQPRSRGERSFEVDAQYPPANAVLDPRDTRNGPFSPTYDPSFLGIAVAVPQDLTDDSLELDGSTVIPYTHYCLALSRSRRLARWVAWNIDGASLKTTDRVGFYADPRLPEEQQVLNRAYDRDNQLDRGHLARRADLIWGPDEEAVRANHQSFAYPNIAPQIDTFNQSDKCGLWGQLEDAVLDQDTLHGGRVSVIAGPLLAADDPPYRDDYVRLPLAYFKIVVYVMDDSLRARCFILDQNLDGLRPAHPLDDFRVKPVPIAAVAERASLRFDDNLVAADLWTEHRELVGDEPDYIDNVSQVRW